MRVEVLTSPCPLLAKERVKKTETAGESGFFCAQAGTDGQQ